MHRFALSIIFPCLLSVFFSSDSPPDEDLFTISHPRADELSILDIEGTIALQDKTILWAYDADQEKLLSPLPSQEVPLTTYPQVWFEISQKKERLALKIKTTGPVVPDSLFLIPLLNLSTGVYHLRITIPTIGEGAVFINGKNAGRIPYGTFSPLCRVAFFKYLHPYNAASDFPARPRNGFQFPLVGTRRHQDEINFTVIPDSPKTGSFLLYRINPRTNREQLVCMHDVDEQAGPLEMKDDRFLHDLDQDEIYYIVKFQSNKKGKEEISLPIFPNP